MEEAKDIKEPKRSEAAGSKEVSGVSEAQRNERPLDPLVMPQTGEDVFTYCRDEDLKRSKSPNIEGQAAAWRTVFDFCQQSGMDINQSLSSGVEQVCKFIRDRGHNPSFNPDAQKRAVNSNVS